MPTPPTVEPEQGPPIWTFRRQLIGNLVPLLVAAPFGVVGLLMMYRDGDMLGRGLWMLALSVAVGIIAVNWLGLFENAAIRRAMERRLPPDLSPVRWFVGATTPSFVGWLDPHEDVGFLWMDATRIGFFGETYRIEIPRAQVTAIRFRPNVHTLIGLGRWISIEAVVDGKPARLKIEPRERRTLLGNRRLGAEIRRKLLER